MDETNSKRPLLNESSLLKDWYAVTASRDVRGTPVPAELGNVPVVVFRDGAGAPAVLVDRCPHRNVPLSLGRVQGHHLECAYHGWQFDRDGTCQSVPGLCRTASHPSRQAQALATRESDGLVWACPHVGVEPAHPPPSIPKADAPGYVTVRECIDMPAPLDAVAENALDVPHTAFLHRGLFRGPAKKHEIEVVVRRDRDRAEAEFIGEPRPGGLIGRLLAPKGGILFHCDRFILPCIAQVEYRLGKTHLITTAALTPIGDNQTRMFATVCLKLPLGGVVAPVFRSVAMRIIRQDATILRAQTASVERFGGEDFTSTEIDVLGPQIKKLLRDAARGTLPDESTERRIKMRV